MIFSKKQITVNYDYGHLIGRPLDTMLTMSTYYADPPSPHKQRDSSAGSEQSFGQFANIDDDDVQCWF